MKNTKGIKIIFIDIDWTLFDDNKIRYPKSGIKAIKKARNNGVKIILCTARCYSSMEFIDALNTIPHDGYICSSGAVCFVDKHYLIKELILPKDVYKVSNYALANNLVLGYIGPDHCYLSDKPNKIIDDYFDSFLEPKPSIYHQYNDEEITTIVLFTDNIKHVDDIKKLGFEVSNFFPNAYDVIKHSCEKGDAIKKVLDYLNYSSDYAMAIGDDVPDISMFKQVKYRVAVGNAKDELKKEATFVTSDINKRGVKKVLKHFDII